MAWNPIDAPIDYVLIGGKRTPGIGVVVGASGPLKWDEQNGYGYSGAFLIFRGARLAHFEVRCSLYTVQDWEDYHSFLPTIKVPTQRFPKALDIWHPFLEQLGIKSVVPEEPKQPEGPDETGVYVWTVKLAQYRRPKLTLVKPEASKDKQSTDPIDLEIEALIGANQRKRDELSR